jgi:peptide/nickel transport system substrate-binding protein
MQFRFFKMRFRRRINKRRQQVEDLGQQAERSVDKLIFKRFSRIAKVRRFVIGWIVLIIVLMGGVLLQVFNLANYYQTVQPVDGGIYREGVLGTFSTANPLYATNQVDSTITKLVFSGLFHYNVRNQLVGDLASGIDLDARGTTYTVHLKPNLTWQDGQPLTSKDVLFTYDSIQNPDAQSPLNGSWQGITVAAPDPLTVTFKLPSPLASFPNNLVNGIVPEHLLKNVAAVDLRTSDFNTVKPIGSGPFTWHAIEVEGNDPQNAQEQLALTPFDHYNGGKPRLDQFVVTAYADQKKLISDFKNGQLNGLAGLNDVPPSLADDADVQIHNAMLTAGVYSFFKTSSPILSSVKVRQALVQAAEPQKIISKISYPTRAVRSPLLKEQVAYDPNYLQLKPNLTAAQTLLDQDGWVAGKDGIRTKDGKPLTFTMVAADSPEYKLVTSQLKQQWRRAGVDLKVRLLDSQDFQNALAYHDYDAVLYGISLGTDPDVFVYWDSTQADIRSANRLNLSEYKSAVADEALESGRTRQDAGLRAVKYRAFLQAWQQDAPALGLYQPRVLYITRGNVAGLTDSVLNTGTDRYNNVQNWQIRQAKVAD